MGMRVKSVKGKPYFYLDLGYRLPVGFKTFSKYIGAKKPSQQKLKQLEENFKSELLQKLYGQKVSSELVSEDDLIKAALFRDLFFKKYDSLSSVKKRKFDVDNTVIFALTTLTTEDVAVDLSDVQNAMEKETGLTLRERISKNMITAVEKIKENEKINPYFLLSLHKTIMATFEGKSPGQLRNKQVYIHRQSQDHPLGMEIEYRPPPYQKIPGLIEKFSDWYEKSKLNPIEKAAVAHFKLYKIHPFLDGNKRICRLLFNKTLLNNGFPLLNISERKETYFESLIESTEKNNPKPLAEFAVKEYFRQVKRFLKSGKNERTVKT